MSQVGDTPVDVPPQPPAAGFPLPPPHLLERIAMDPSQENFAASFAFLNSSVRTHLAAAGCDFGDFRDILDLGCGVGRFLFAFRPDLLPHQRLYGCDVAKVCADWCQENIDFAEVVNNPIDPPLPYEDHKFDFAYALSVFTHLTLDLQFRWAWEIHRVLEPGGVFFFTIHGVSFFPTIYENYRAAAVGSNMYSFGDDALFATVSFPSDYEEERQDEGQLAVAAMHTQGVIAELFSGFDRLLWVPGSNLANGQDLYVVRKPHAAPPLARPQGGATSVEEVMGEGVEFRFDLDRQRRFRVYPTVEPEGIQQLTCHATVSVNGLAVDERELSFGHGRAFGPTHHACLELDLPPQHGQVSVTLRTAASPQRPLPEGVEPKVVWSFANFT